MMSIKTIAILSLLLCQYIGHTQTEIPTSHIELKTFYHNNEVKLRWMVVDMDMWQWGNDVGYTISRTTLEENGSTLPYVAQLNSKVLIVENLKPYSSAEIESNFQNNDYAEAAGKLLYDDTINDTTMPVGSATFADAIMAEEKKNTQHVFSLLTSEFDYDAACALGLAYTDQTAQANKKYAYSIQFSQAHPSEYDIIDFNDAEDGWGIWNDGGTHSYKPVSPYPYSGKKTLALRNGNATSVSYTDPLQLSGVDTLIFEYTMYPHSVEVGEKYHVEISYDNGTTYEVIQSKTCGTDFNTKIRVFDTVRLSSPSFNDQTRLRLRAESNQNSDYFIFDDLKVATVLNDGRYNLISLDNMESGWGIWNDGGTHNWIWTFRAQNSGQGYFAIRNGQSTSILTSDIIDLQNKRNVKVAFTALVYLYESGESFNLQYSNDNGQTYTELKRWTVPTTARNQRMFDTVTVSDIALTDQSKFRFQSFGNDNNDIAYIDDIMIYTEDNKVVKYDVVETDQNHQLKAPKVTYGEGGTNIATIEWDVSDPESLYTSYDIERSTNGLSYTKINDLPYVYMTTEGADTGIASYVDDLPDNNTTYIYRVCGKSSYGVTSPPSDTIHIKGIPPKLDMVHKIDTLIYMENNDNIEVKWTTQTGAIKNAITGYDVLRASDFKGPYVKLNTNLLNNSTFSYLDIDPLSAGYYKVIAYDSDHRYETLEKSKIKPDDTPPGVPNLQSVEFYNESELKITWTEVVAEDLYGYRLYFANGKNGNYMEITGTPVIGDTYNHYIDQSFEVDSIYIKIAAQDMHDNISDKSSAMGASRPDVHAPSPPAIASVYPNPDGIEISWRYSTSDDTEDHILQRRAANSPTWVDLVTVSKNDQSSYNVEQDSVSYVDSTYQHIQEYQYRLVAIDGNDNLSSSRSFSTTPIRVLVDGQVTQVDIQTETVTTAQDPRILNQLANLDEAGYSQFNNKSLSSTVNINLSWQYPLDPNLKEFKIYRAITGSTMKEYRTVSLAAAMGFPDTDINVTGPMGLQTYTYKDEQLVKNKRYVYEIKAVHHDGSVSHRSSSVSKKLEN